MIRHPQINVMAAMAENRVIGKEGGMPWRLPDELKHFKQTTIGHPLIMGRRTFESFGRPLPRRRNIVLTRDATYGPARIETVGSLDEALALVSGADAVFIVGGEAIYRAILPRADRLYLTRVHARPEGDRFFPEFDLDQWALVDRRAHPADQRHVFAFTFEVYERRRPLMRAAFDPHFDPHHGSSPI